MSEKMDYKQFMDFVEEIEAQHTQVKDGIYDITGIPFIQMKQDNREEIEAFISRHGDVFLANAYETYTYFLFASEPQEFGGVHFGDGFNYGSTNILAGCPNSILILAEND